QPALAPLRRPVPPLAARPPTPHRLHRPADPRPPGHHAPPDQALPSSSPPQIPAPPPPAPRPPPRPPPPPPPPPRPPGGPGAVGGPSLGGKAPTGHFAFLVTVCRRAQLLTADDRSGPQWPPGRGSSVPHEVPDRQDEGLPRASLPEGADDPDLGRRAAVPGP